MDYHLSKLTQQKQHPPWPDATFATSGSMVGAMRCTPYRYRCITPAGSGGLLPVASSSHTAELGDKSTDTLNALLRIPQSPIHVTRPGGRR